MHIVHQRGFTVVELTLVIILIGILSSIAILNVSNSNIVARDTEREEDARAIARQLEAVYEDTASGSDTIASYPGTNEIIPTMGELGADVIRAPGVASTDPSSIWAATNTNQTANGVTPKPGKSQDKYIYQPLKSDNSLCTATAADPTNACVKFNLFYYVEKTNTVQRIMSKNR